MVAETEEVKITDGLKRFIDEWRDKPGNLIMVLHRIQGEYGYIPRQIVIEVSRDLGIPLAKMYGIITFYHYFKLKKPGKNKVSVCMGTACYLKGAEDLLFELEKLTGSAVNATSADGLFSLEAVRCIGCCGLAPVITVNGDVYGKLKKAGLTEIVEKYRNA